MIGRVLSLLILISVTGCAGTQQQEIIQQAKAQLRSIRQSCIQRMQIDPDLDPIRTKIELSRTTMSGAPPPAMLAEQSRPTSEEMVAIEKWSSIREDCTQEAIQYWMSLSVPANFEASRDKILLVLRRADERTGLRWLQPCMADD
jgi:hypothetical protein